jgi:dethiobiotin synthetase
MKNQSYFIAGTDTGVGKTLITLSIMQSLQKTGLSVCGMKPVASGCDLVNGQLVSEDAAQIKKHGSQDLPLIAINPLAFKSPCSPNIAAEIEGKVMDMGLVVHAYNEIQSLVDIVLVEGVGGWRSPCFSSLGMADIAKVLQLPVILVVGIKLGCINHALLSVECILRDNVNLAGWVANMVVPDFKYTEETVNYIKGQIKAPLLGTVPYLAPLDYQRLHQYISVQDLMADNDDQKLMI